MFYIGKHQTKELNDYYFGSGKYLKRAISQYGRANFDREILYVFDSEQEMNDKEKEIVNEELVNNKLSYNIGIGGEGGPMFSGKRHSASTKERISNTMKLKNFKHSDETKKIISEKNKGNKSTTGYIWMNNGKEAKLIKRKRFKYYYELGYRRGKKV